jgi:formate hydrogenlyase transcriptional activator
MGTNVSISPRIGTQRYETVVRISESLSAYRQPDRRPEELAKVVAEHLSKVLAFDYLDVTVFKENSKEIEWRAWGKGHLACPEVPMEERPTWHVYDTQEALHIADWGSDERFPRAKELARNLGITRGSVVRVPLTTPHRRLGTLGIISAAGTTYSTEDISFLRLITSVLAFAIDDGLNLRSARSAQASLQRQKDRLQLLLNLTNQITSNLDLHRLLRAISANVREVMHCDAAAICLFEPGAERYKLYGLDFPDSKGFFAEGQLITTVGVAKCILETQKPIILNNAVSDEMPPEISDKVLAEGLRSRCLIPLVHRRRALGFLTVARTTEDSFTPEDVEFLTQASGQIAIAVENALAYQEISELKDKLAQEKLYLEDEIRGEMDFAQIIGASPALRKVLKLVETVAPTDSTVLINGETGTGKELIARAIHDLSSRRSKAFVKLNCAAIPTGLLESELFGHEKGAFTGAIAQRIGRFEVANGGTIFLDEIGEIPLELQTKLLRVLQEREFERLGSSRTLRTDARLIAATNRDLQAMVAEQKFRSDLFFRLNVVPLHVPPLRERHGDIALLMRHFAQHFSKRMKKVIDTIPSATMDALCRYHWPGNIRELQNVIERAVILSAGPALEVDIGDLKLSKSISAVEKRAYPASTNGGLRSGLRDMLAETEREQILEALKQCNWVVAGPNGAAALLGMDRSTLRLRIQKLGISRPSTYSRFHSDPRLAEGSH